MKARSVALALAMLAGALMQGCASGSNPRPSGAGAIEKPTGVSWETFVPNVSGGTEALETSSPLELHRLSLVATNLVSAAAQIPALDADDTVLQVQRPTSAFGNVLFKTFEDVGYALRVVATDLGPRYVSYSRYMGEGDRGNVLEFRLAIGDISLERQFRIDDDGYIYPASLLRIDGSDHSPDVAALDVIFSEQGSDATFVSGVLLGDSGEIVGVDEKVSADYSAARADERTSASALVEAARRQRMLEKEAPDFERLEKYRRTVLIMEGDNTEYLGDGNKRAVSLMAREHREGDVYVITGCIDVDGENDISQERALRVEEELRSHGIAAEATYVSPCVRASYRHPLDTSPEPITLTHYRPTGAAR
ncbi:MAG: hypothetical protein CSB44_09855 [Gammaproteobacteria bacterium]|nr:MAG: hypothetical protein CSB44_09855 [Gammaproteobacteria bacterium]